MSRLLSVLLVIAVSASGACARVADLGLSRDADVTDASVDAGGTSGAGDECADDSDCPGGSCLALAPGGVRVCQVPPIEPTTCANAFDECCDAMPCSGVGERCVLAPPVPYCGGAMMVEHNTCAADRCSDDGDCGGNAICLPAGTLGRKVRACMSASCRSDSDCTAMAGGACVPVTESCCGSIAGLYCTYASALPCRSDADCATDEICQIDGDVAHCQAGFRVCPL